MGSSFFPEGFFPNEAFTPTSRTWTSRANENKPRPILFAIKSFGWRANFLSDPVRNGSLFFDRSP